MLASPPAFCCFLLKWDFCDQFGGVALPGGSGQRPPHSPRQHGRGPQAASHTLLLPLLPLVVHMEETDGVS